MKTSSPATNATVPFATVTAEPPSVMGWPSTRVTVNASPSGSESLPSTGTETNPSSPTVNVSSCATGASFTAPMTTVAVAVSVTVAPPVVAVSTV